MSERYQRLLSLIMQHANANEGYSQPHRWSWLDKANRKIIPNKEGDCSAVTIGLIWLAGYPVPDANIGGTLTCYTGNAYDLLHTKAGLTATAVKGWTIGQINSHSVPGSALLKDGHIMIKAPVAGDMWYSMNHDENGGAAGGHAGDQKGDESTIRSLWMPSIGWQYIFTPTDADGTTSVNSTTPTTDTINAPVQNATPKPPPGLTSGTTLTDGYTNVRTGPTTDYSVVGTIPPNTLVTGTLVDGWIKITTAPAQYAGDYVSTKVLAGVTTTPAEAATPAPPVIQGQVPPVTTTTTTVAPVADPPPPARQTLVGLLPAAVQRLQTRLNEHTNSGLTITGVLDDPTIRAWQLYVGTPPDGAIGMPSNLVKAVQEQLNSYRDLRIASESKINSMWKSVRADGMWDFATAVALTDYLLYWDGMHL